MSAKESFVLKALEPGANRAALCREHGISRKTGYKWLKRYEEDGLAGLEDVTRRPQSSPLEVSGEVVAEVVRIRKAHGWGARKIRAALEYERPDLELPSSRTVHRILVRTGFLQPARRRKRDRSSNGPKTPPRVTAKAPNDVWTVDFKGWWLALNKERCEPLTVRDSFSRFILAIEVLPSNTMAPVRAIFEELFKKYGLPKAILTDNGPPWVATQGELGLTRLSVWWTSLGIEHVRTRPGKPCDNGGHERMHKDMAEQLEALGALTRKNQQHACDRFRHDFNCHRPHEAIANKRPADLYVRSEVAYNAKETEPVYPEHFLVRKVQKRGAIGLGRFFVFVSSALQKQYVGLEPTGPHTFNLFFFHKYLGVVDTRSTHPNLKPIRWKDTAVLLPKAA